jgi:anti-sigma regulatory factor (Ser/Thr protein kinase)
VRTDARNPEDARRGTAVTTLTTRTHHFRQSVGLDAVEERLRDWPTDRDREAETILNLAECRNVDPGAGMRLTNAMRRWAAGRLVVVVPRDADLHGSDWFRLFTRSGLGWGMAAHADAVLCGDRDIVEDLRAYYASTSPSHAVNCVMFKEIESGALVPNQDRFVSTLLQAVRQYLRQAHESLAGPHRRSLARLAHEAVTNVVDHAFAAPWVEQEQPLGYLSVRWYRTVSAKNDELGGLRSYIEAHRERLAAADVLAGWMEIVVADDGVGIAARHAQMDEVSMYTGPRAAEDKALLTALESSETVKLRTLDAQVRGEPGYGTAIMLECLNGLKAYAAVRTGRRLVEFNPWRQERFELNDTHLGWLPGTAVQVLLPVLDPQLRLT